VIVEIFGMRAEVLETVEGLGHILAFFGELEFWLEEE